jgi:hypothetical protein
MAEQPAAAATAAPRRVLVSVADDDASEAVFSWAIANEFKPTDEVHLLHVTVAIAHRDLRVSFV